MPRSKVHHPHPLCFLILLAAATFRLDERDSITDTESLDRALYDHLTKREKINSLLQGTFRPENTLMTDVQICLMFWILGRLFVGYLLVICFVWSTLEFIFCNIWAVIVIRITLCFFLIIFCKIRAFKVIRIKCKINNN
jgi:hypothetical protein